MSTSLYIYAEREGRPNSDLFVTFHGTGGNENQFTGLAKELLPSAHIISPRGDVSEGGALRFFRRKAEGVYDMDDLVQRTALMASFVQSHIDRVKPKRVIGLGYSNGANILASTMFENGDLFDKAVLMHPLIPFMPQPQSALKDRSILITAGERDPICPADLTLGLESYFKAQQAHVQTVWHNGGREIRQNELEAAKAFLTE